MKRVNISCSSSSCSYSCSCSCCCSSSPPPPSQPLLLLLLVMVMMRNDDYNDCDDNDDDDDGDDDDDCHHHHHHHSSSQHVSLVSFWYKNWFHLSYCGYFNLRRFEESNPQPRQETETRSRKDLLAFMQIVYLPFSHQRPLPHPHPPPHPPPHSPLLLRPIRLKDDSQGRVLDWRLPSPCCDPLP